MNREKITERDNLTYDEVLDIAKKSHDRCCHCGKLAYFGGDATVDHFIPISKGGTNRKLNLVMLCKSCNKKKSDRIVYPKTYLPYLDPKELEDLTGYFDSYIKSFEYVSRKNLLALDEYLVNLMPDVHGLNGKKGKFKTAVPTMKFVLERVNGRSEELGGNIDLVKKYYREYLKKLKMDDSTADKQIDFWYRFGCLYYIGTATEIKCLFAVTIKSVPEIVGYEGIPFVTNIAVFSKYANIQSYVIATYISSQIVFWLQEEQDIKKMPAILQFYKNDPFAYKIASERGKACIEEEGKMISRYNIYSITVDDIDASNESTNKFFSTFNDVTAEATKYLSRPENKDIADMKDYLIWNGDYYEEAN